MYLKICCCSCSIVALKANQGYLTPLCILSTCFFRSCSVVEVIFTLRTWISYSFMLTFNMNLQMTCSSCKQQVYSLQYHVFQYSIHLNINTGLFSTVSYIPICNTSNLYRFILYSIMYSNI